MVFGMILLKAMVKCTSYKIQVTKQKDTLWKAFNCVTYNEDHLRGGENNVSSRLKNNLINNGKDNIKDRAMNKALELAA